MPMDPMTGQQMPYGDDIDIMAMEQALGAGAPMPPAMGPDMGMGGAMVPVEVPEWAVPAVQELISILEAEIASGNITPEMLMDLDGSTGMDPMMGDPMMGGAPPMM